MSYTKEADKGSLPEKNAQGTQSLADMTKMKYLNDVFYLTPMMRENLTNEELRNHVILFE